MPPFPPNSSLAAYLRDSGGDDQDLSTSQQESEIRRWCDDHSYLLSRIFSDVARPGSSTIGRAGFQEMIAHFRDPACSETGIIVWKFSRFARDIDDAQFYRADLRRRGFEIHSINDNIPAGLDGRLFESIIEWKDAKFLEDLSIDVKRGLRQLVEQYGAVPGTPPRGFKREPITLGARRDGSTHVAHRWAPDADLAPQVRQAFAMCAAGESYKAIMQETHLYRSINSYPTFFTNRLYIGELIFGDLVIPDYCPPIVDRSTWETVQGIISARAHATASEPGSVNHPRRRSSDFILSGLLYCGHCGSPMNGCTITKQSGETWKYYDCSRRKRRRDCQSLPITQLPLEELILNYLRDQIFTPTNLASMQAEEQRDLNSRLATIDGERAALNRQLAGVRRSADHITNAIAETGHNRSLLDKLTQLERQERQLTNELTALDRLADQNSIPPMGQADLDQQHQRITAILSSDRSETRQSLRALVHRITLQREEKTIHGVIYYHNLPLKQNTPSETGKPGGDEINYAYGLNPRGGTIHRHNPYAFHFESPLPRKKGSGLSR